MIGQRYYDEERGWGTIVAETDIKFMVEYDNEPWLYGIFDKEEKK